MAADPAALPNEPAIRLAAFACVLLAMLIWERLAPRRVPAAGQAVRRLNNLALAAVGTLLLRTVFPVLALALAVLAQERGIGVFNIVAMPAGIAVAAAVLLLDLIIYGQHRLFHAVPWLWRLHRMHHADPDFDTTTALRFHPLEILLSMLIKMAAVLALGAPPLAVMLFEIILNASAMFNHGNVALPAALERALRRIIITPDLHRIHHSARTAEMNRNFGFNLSVWDRWFGTLQNRPCGGHTAMAIGLKTFGSRRDQWLDRLLLQPIRKD